MRRQYSQLVASLFDAMDTSARSNLASVLLHSAGLGMVTNAGVMAGASKVPSIGGNLRADRLPNLTSVTDYEYIMYMRGDDREQCPAQQHGGRWPGRSGQKLCPWVRAYNVNEHRYPVVLADVRCLCQRCLDYQDGRQDGASLRAPTCEKVQHLVPVLYRVQNDTQRRCQVVEGFANVASGCTCSRPSYSIPLPNHEIQRERQNYLTARYNRQSSHGNLHLNAETGSQTRQQEILGFQGKRGLNVKRVTEHKFDDNKENLGETQEKLNSHKGTRNLMHTRELKAEDTSMLRDSGQNAVGYKTLGNSLVGSKTDKTSEIDEYLDSRHDTNQENSIYYDTHEIQQSDLNLNEYSDSKDSAANTNVKLFENFDMESQEGSQFTLENSNYWYR